MALYNWPHLFGCAYSFVGGFMIGIVVGIISARLIWFDSIKELKRLSKQSS
jgi:hypothetical protein